MNHPATLFLASTTTSSGQHSEWMKIWVNISDISVDVGVKILCMCEKHLIIRPLQTHDDSSSNDCQSQTLTHCIINNNNNR